MKVTRHTPAWLSRPSPGFEVFQPSEKPKAQSSLSNGYGKKVDNRGPIRTIAHRGTEVFFVVENELRWTDLVYLKEAGSDSADRCSRTLKAPVPGQIRQIIISPLGDYLAIATSHTIHVAILPKQLDGQEPGPIKLKTFQLGPTAHVLEQAPLASVLWHPFGVLGSCLVTVAQDACVRLWELDVNNRGSFSDPTMAVDMKKLANASSYGEDMRASVYGTSKGFSPDLVEMEVAAAAFGGIGSPDELGWAPMTLWVAMTEGDLYALCPLLPSRWQPSISTIPSLSTSVVSTASILDRSPDVSEEERRQAVQQQKWLADIDAQEPLLELLPDGLDTVEIYQRPSHPPAIPKLQGPFHLTPDTDIDDISDILVFAPRIDDTVFDEGEDYEYDQEHQESGLSIGLVCLLAKSATIHVCLDIAGVQAAWLPSRRSGFSMPTSPAHGADLLVQESIYLGAGEATDSYPAFTPIISNNYLASEPLYDQHPFGKYSFLVTQLRGVHAVNLTPWISNLEDELSGLSDTGSSFRLGLIHETDRSIVSSLISIPSPHRSTPAAITLLDSDLSHFILTTNAHQPYAAALELPSLPKAADPYAPSTEQALGLPSTELRESYLPARDFFLPSQLPCVVDQTLHSNARLKRSDITSPLRLSPATLQLLTDAHRILSEETNRLGVAAADLFRRCQRMQVELGEQVRRMREIRDRSEDIGGQATVDGRIAKVRERGEKLRIRVEEVRRKVAGLQTGVVSQREEAWVKEVQELDRDLEGRLGERVKMVKEMTEDIVSKANRVRKEGGLEEGKGVSNEMRKKKLDQLMILLERESALVEAVGDRLGRLNSQAAR